MASGSSGLVRFVHMRVPEATRRAPVPVGIDAMNALGNEALVLDDQRDSDQIGKETLIHQTDFKIVSQNQRRSESRINVGSGDAHCVVVVPQQPGTLIHWVIVSRGVLRRISAGHVHETRAGKTIGREPLERGAVTEPGSEAAVQMSYGAVHRQASN